MIVADTSPLIILGRLNRLDILKALFGQVAIPTSVYQEAVTESTFKSQSESILLAIEDNIILVIEPTIEHQFEHRLDLGEIGVLELALEQQAQAIIMDDKKARNEATEMGFTLFFTTDILKGAAKRNLIETYSVVRDQLAEMQIHLPE